MGKHIWVILALLLCMVGVSEAQVTQGTVFSKTQSGSGVNIGSNGAGNSLNVVCTGGTCTGVAGVAYLDADAIANQTVNAVHGQTYMYNGATWDRVRGTIAGGLQVNCITGCAGGASTPTDAFANPTTAGLQQTFNMVYNGATWDMLRGTVAGGALVNVSNASLAVTNAGLTNLDVALSTRSSEATLATRLADATFTGRFPVAYVDADNIANQTTTAIHGQTYLYDGATWDRAPGNSVDGMLVNLGANNDVTVTSGSITVSNAFLLDATLTGRFPAGSTPADNESNAVTITRIGNFNYVFDGTTWDRWTGTVTANAGTNLNTSALVLDATVTNRLPAGSTPADNESNAITTSRLANYNYWFDGATWDRALGNSTDGLLVNLGTNNDVIQATASNLNVRQDTSGATGAAPPARADFIGGLSSGATGGLVQGVAVCDTFVNINISTVTTTLLVTGVAGRHVRICSMNIVTTLANTVALISGTGATCGTGTTGMNGGTTAATGWSFATNGGLTQGSGVGVINQTNAVADSVCLVSGVATQLSGRISYTIY